MVEWHYKSKRKPSGGILNTPKRADKKLAQMGGIFSSTTIAKTDKDVLIDNHRGMGGKLRQKAKSVLFANVVENGKMSKAKVLVVVENSANRLYTRRNIITKGAFIKILLDGTEKTARVTSRPGQDGVVNAVVTKDTFKAKKAEKTEKKHKAPAKEEKELPVQEESLSKEKADKHHKKHEKAPKIRK